ncbi:erythromycin esterase family protein [Holdemanella biformis]
MKEIVQKIGFQIYKTEEMMQLIEYMREYNDDAEEEQLNFYGFDM